MNEEQVYSTNIAPSMPDASTRAAMPRPDAGMLAWALYYAQLGWPVFPCHGKAPATRRGFYDASSDPAQITLWWEQWPLCNIGAPMGHGLWALDEDPRHDGDASRVALERQHESLPDTMRSLSGRRDGGGHSFWVWPEGGLEHKAALGDGLDVIGRGGYVILPPSIHPDTGLSYEWEIGPDELWPVRAPGWLEALVTPKAPSSHSGAPSAEDVPEDSPIPEGQRNATLTRLAGSLRRQGFSAQDIYPILATANLRCVPPLPDDELHQIAGSVARYAPSPDPVLYVAPAKAQAPSAPPLGWPGGDSQASRPFVQGGTEPWREWLICKKNGDPVQAASNLTVLLGNHSFWARENNALWWDAVRSRPMMGQAEIDDDTMTCIAEWFGTNERLPISNLRLLERCVLMRCRANQRDLLQHMLHALPAWDGTPRLGTWLQEVAHVEDSAYAQAVSRLLPLSMVARALDPGCLYRYVVILEGPEEAGKSTLVRALAGEGWYVELSIALESKESHMMLQGAWVAELAELDSLSRTEETRLKAFITLKEDSYIPKYSNYRVSTPRRTVFIGTTNEETYLKGQTGNTRFLPVRVGTIDIPAFLAIREQLLSEALRAYQADPATWWRLSDEANTEAQEQRERRRLVNVYEDPLQHWLERGRFEAPAWHEGAPVTFVAGETSWPEIALHYLGLKTPAEWRDKSLQMQIAAGLKALGWHQKIIERSGQRSKRWMCVKPTTQGPTGEQADMPPANSSRW